MPKDALFFIHKNTPSAPTQSPTHTSHQNHTLFTKQASTTMWHTQQPNTPHHDLPMHAIILPTKIYLTQQVCNFHTSTSRPSNQQDVPQKKFSQHQPVCIHIKTGKHIFVTNNTSHHSLTTAPDTMTTDTLTHQSTTMNLHTLHRMKTTPEIQIPFQQDPTPPFPLEATDGQVHFSMIPQNLQFKLFDRPLVIQDSSWIILCHYLKSMILNLLASSNTR